MDENYVVGETIARLRKGILPIKSVVVSPRHIDVYYPDGIIQPLMFVDVDLSRAVGNMISDLILDPDALKKLVGKVSAAA